MTESERCKRLRSRRRGIPAGCHARRRRQAGRRRRGRRSAGCSRRRSGSTVRCGCAHPRPRLGRRRTPRHRHLQPQGLHPAHPAVPRPVPLLHVRHRARQAGGRGAGALPEPRRGAGDRSPGRGTGLQGGPLHTRRPARGSMARGGGVAGGGRIRDDAGVRPRHGDPRARGDRAASAPQSRRHVVGRDEPAQGGRAEHGDDAGDHQSSPLRRARAAALQESGQGPGRPPARARGRRTPFDPVHHGRAHRHRRDAARASGRTVRTAPRPPRVRLDPGSDRPELPSQARHGHASRRRLGRRGVPRGARDGADRPRPAGAHSGPAQPGRPRGVPSTARGGSRRFRRHQPAHARPREPRAPVAADRRPRGAVRRSRFRAARASHRTPRTTGRALGRSPASLSRRRVARTGRIGRPEGHTRRARRGRSRTAASSTPAVRTCTTRSTPKVGRPTGAATSTTSTETGRR